MKRIINLLSICAILILGAGCVTGERLESGGAYAATSTKPANAELYAIDASFDLAHAALDGVFKYEQANRKLLWNITPNIKHSLDKIRDEAGVVKIDYATARKAYEESPSPDGLDKLSEYLGKLQKANAAAVAVIQTKGGGL